LAAEHRRGEHGCKWHYASFVCTADIEECVGRGCGRFSHFSRGAGSLTELSIGSADRNETQWQLGVTKK
jgi:hypothetical protein